MTTEGLSAFRVESAYFWLSNRFVSTEAYTTNEFLCFETLLSDMGHRSGTRQNPNRGNAYVSRRTFSRSIEKGSFTRKIGTILIYVNASVESKVGDRSFVSRWVICVQLCHHATFCDQGTDHHQCSLYLFASNKTMTLEPIIALSLSSFWKMTPPRDMKPSALSYFDVHEECEEEDHQQHMPREQQVSHAARVENATNDIGLLDPVPLHPSACQAVQHLPVSEIWDQSLRDQERKTALLEFSDLILGVNHPWNNTSATRQELPASRSATTRNSPSPQALISSNMMLHGRPSSRINTTGSAQSSWQRVASHASTNPLGMYSLSSPAASMLASSERAMDPTTLMQEDDESTAASLSSGNVDTKTESLVHQDRWDERFEELKRFVGQNGHCHVPTHLSSNPSLARWCKRQRYQYKLKKSGGHSTLTDEREQKLNDVNFVWDVHSSSWEERYMELLDFKMKYGHTNVPRSRGKLGSWVKSQRRQYSLYIRNEKSHLTPNRVAKMNSIGFEWVGSKSPFPRDERRTDNSR